MNCLQFCSWWWMYSITWQAQLLVSGKMDSVTYSIYYVQVPCLGNYALLWLIWNFPCCIEVCAIDKYVLLTCILYLDTKLKNFSTVTCYETSTVPTLLKNLESQGLAGSVISFLEISEKVWEFHCWTEKKCYRRKHFVFLVIFVTLK